MNAIWAEIARLVARYRGVLVAGLGSAIAVAATLDPAHGLARSGMRFALWFALVSVALTVAVTGTMMIAERLAVRRYLPRAVAVITRKRYSASSSAR
ncbi:MAG: hypothetical protein HOV81_12910 [Kofleriaceae bacterium]|nr:hypothetical protein [Kofleriaceae bacterium]